jgi:hypothetical protein
VFEKKFITDAINRSATKEVDRRKLLTMAGLAGIGAATALASATPAFASSAKSLVPEDTGPVDDGAILNFALNLEYLEAEFYLRAYTGVGLPSTMIGGTGTPGKVTGGKKVPFKNPVVKAYAKEIASDEKEHVAFLRKNLGDAAVSRPAISLDASFTAAATAAGLIKKGQTFDPYKNDLNFLLAAFLFEDVGVTAYKGAAPFLSNKTFLGAAAGILAVEAYHAGIIRSSLYAMGEEKGHTIWHDVNLLSDARDSLDGPSDDDQHIWSASHGPNITPTDANGLAYGRSTAQVLNIVYLNPKPVTKGGFFPAGVNGGLNTSGPVPAS